MAVLAQAEPLDLQSEMRGFIGRHTDKSFDWDAFPGNLGFPDLARAQMRYIGAGGSPKADDPQAGAIHSEPRAPAGWQIRRLSFPRGGRAFPGAGGCADRRLGLGRGVIEARLGPKDMVLNQLGRPHGFRNDGVEPVLMSISVGSGMPKPPVYFCHPREADPEIARRFGASTGRTYAFDPHSGDPRQREFARHIVRHAEQRPLWEAGFARFVYIGEGGAPPGGYRMDMVHLPEGAAVRGYARPMEEAYFVLEGCISVGWEGGGDAVEGRLGAKDLILNPRGRIHYFRNDGTADAEFMMLVGTPQTEDIRFQIA